MTKSAQEINTPTFYLQNDIVIESSELHPIVETKVTVVLPDLEVEGSGAREGNLHLEHLTFVNRLVSNRLLQLWRL